MSPVAAKITVVVINYNTAHYLEKCIPSILDQTYQNLEIIFIDNGSPEKEGLDLMHKLYDQEPRIRIIANTVNKGYARAANQGIKMAMSRDVQYIAIANCDVVFAPDYFEKAVSKMEEDHKIAALTGKILKYDYKNEKATDIIDSIGLFAYKNRRIIDDGQGLIDKGQFNKEGEVFGVSGACPVYRAKALEECKVMDEYFDEDFFMYKEDVDLSWRFLLYGWKNYYYPEALAYHGRGTHVQKRFFATDMIKSRRKLSHLQKKLSFRNQLLMELKNDFRENRTKDFLPIAIRKLLVPVYMIFVEPYLWISYFQYLRLVPKMLKKRKIIREHRKTPVKEMRKWFKKQSEIIS